MKKLINTLILLVLTVVIVFFCQENSRTEQPTIFVSNCYKYNNRTFEEFIKITKGINSDFEFCPLIPFEESFMIASYDMYSKNHEEIKKLYLLINKLSSKTGAAFSYIMSREGRVYFFYDYSDGRTSHALVLLYTESIPEKKDILNYMEIDKYWYLYEEIVFMEGY